jgi:hypothetical protein
MLFDDISMLNDIIAMGRSTSIFRDDHDPEVNRLFNSSPPITEYGGTYDMSYFKNDDEYFTMEDESPKKEPMEPKNDQEVIEERLVVTGSPNRLFEYHDVPLREHIRSQKSSLTPLLGSVLSNDSQDDDIVEDLSAKRMALTIYLPDCSSMTVDVRENDNFNNVIKKILKTHKELKMAPPLKYHNSDFYELRMHEGMFVKRHNMKISYESLIVF